jgi:hypothetical protein
LDEVWQGPAGPGGAWQGSMDLSRWAGVKMDNDDLEFLQRMYIRVADLDAFQGTFDEYLEAVRKGESYAIYGTSDDMRRVLRIAKETK